MRTALLVALVCLVPLATADDWPRWRGANADGHTAEKGLLDKWPAAGPTKLWSVSGFGVGWTSASIVKDRIYLTGMSLGKGLLFCLDLAGKKQWMSDYGKEWSERGRMKFPGAHSTPTIDGDQIYLMTGYGVAICLSAKDGKKIWSVDTFAKYGGKNIMWGISESVLADDSGVYVTPGGPGASVVKLDKKTGKLLWKTGGLSATSAYCSPIFVTRGKTKILVTMLANSIVGLDPATGKTLWSAPHRNMYSVHSNTPLLSASGLLFACSGYGRGSVALKLSDDGTKSSIAWEKKILDTHHGGNVMIGDHVYGTSSKRPRKRLICLDVKTGEVKAESRAISKGAIIAAEGLLYCYGESGTVALVKPSPDGLTTLGSFKVTEGTKEHWAHPSIANGVLYIRHGTHLMAYDIKKK